MAIEYLGNKTLLDVPKTAFLASNNYGSKDVLRCYDWATETRDRGECVVSGFSSPLEQDILPFLLKGTQPIIIVLARRMYQQCPPKWQAALDADRLLIVSVSPIPPSIQSHRPSPQPLHPRTLRQSRPRRHQQNQQPIRTQTNLRLKMHRH